MAGVVLDANFLIALYNEKDAHHTWAHDVALDTLGDELYIPALSFAETLVRPARAGQADLMAMALDDLGVQVIPLLEGSASYFAQVRADSGLRMPDAVVLHAALENDCTIATSDGVLAKAAQAAGVTVFKP